VTGVAVVGGLATDPGFRWYARLRKPVWQPPGSAFPLVSTPLYGLIAYVGARALDRDPPRLAVNLVISGLCIATVRRGAQAEARAGRRRLRAEVDGNGRVPVGVGGRRR
jgi:hypothetical protein